MPKVTVKPGQLIRIGDVTLCISQVPERTRFCVEVMEIPQTTHIEVERGGVFHPFSKKFTGIPETALDTVGSTH